MIQEMKLACGRYVYFANIDGVWTDLSPYGNRLPE